MPEVKMPTPPADERRALFDVNHRCRPVVPRDVVDVFDVKIGWRVAMLGPPKVRRARSRDCVWHGTKRCSRLPPAVSEGADLVTALAGLIARGQPRDSKYLGAFIGDAVPRL